MNYVGLILWLIRTLSLIHDPSFLPLGGRSPPVSEPLFSPLTPVVPNADDAEVSAEFSTDLRNRVPAELVSATSSVRAFRTPLSSDNYEGLMVGQ